MCASLYETREIDLFYSQMRRNLSCTKFESFLSQFRFVIFDDQITSALKALIAHARSHVGLDRESHGLRPPFDSHTPG